MADWIIIYDLSAIIVGAASSAVVLVLYAKSRNHRIPAYLASNGLALVIVLALTGYQYGLSRGYDASIALAIINYAICGLCATIPRITKPAGPSGKASALLRAFDLPAILLAALLLVHDLFLRDGDLYLALYIALYSLMSIAYLHFSLGGLFKGREKRRAGSLGRFHAMLSVTRLIALALFPVFVLTDFFGWLIPPIAAILPGGFAILPLYLIAMDLCIVAGAAVEILEPVALSGQREIGEDLATRLGLSKREAEIAPLVLQCLSYKEIGERLFISPGTVRSHLAHIYRKTGARNRLELSRLVLAGESSKG